MFHWRRPLSPFARRIFLVVLVGLAAAYLSVGGYLWWTMHQPPEAIAGAVARMPQLPVVFQLYPFETLWTHARAGSLNIGDQAPDFSLLKVDKSERIQLSALNRQRPVVLVFGSYT